MLRGIYSSATGMINEMTKVSMHAGNIANAQTAGFKKREMDTIPFKEIMINVLSEKGDMEGFGDRGIQIGGRMYDSIKVPIGTGAGSGFMRVDESQGVLKTTGNFLDLAFDGGGWFSIGKRDRINGGLSSETFTTRNGRFLLDTEGYIITPEGDYLLSDNNDRIQIPENNENSNKPVDQRITVREDGTILDAGVELNRIQVRRSVDALEVIPELKMSARATEPAPDMRDLNNRMIRVKQGFIEQGNVNIIEEMIGLIHSSKTYESGHKLIMSADKILDKSINELGRTG